MLDFFYQFFEQLVVRLGFFTNEFVIQKTFQKHPGKKQRVSKIRQTALSIWVTCPHDESFLPNCSSCQFLNKLFFLKLHISVNFWRGLVLQRGLPCQKKKMQVLKLLQNGASCEPLFSSLFLLKFICWSAGTEFRENLWAKSVDRNFEKNAIVSAKCCFYFFYCVSQRCSSLLQPPLGL